MVTRRAKVGRGTAARDGQKCEEGTQRRKGRRGLRGGCGDGAGARMRTLPLVVAFIIAKSDDAIMQLPSANVYDPQRLLRQGACARDG